MYCLPLHRQTERGEQAMMSLLLGVASLCLSLSANLVVLFRSKDLVDAVAGFSFVLALYALLFLISAASSDEFSPICVLMGSCVGLVVACVARLVNIKVQ